MLRRLICDLDFWKGVIVKFLMTKDDLKRITEMIKSISDKEKEKFHADLAGLSVEQMHENERRYNDSQKYMNCCISAGE